MLDYKKLKTKTLELSHRHGVANNQKTNDENLSSNTIVFPLFENLDKKLT